MDVDLRHSRSTIVLTGGSVPPMMDCQRRISLLRCRAILLAGRFELSGRQWSSERRAKDSRLQHAVKLRSIINRVTGKLL